MLRGRKIVIISHCLLNANAKVDGLATYKGSVPELLDILRSEELGIYQLPCPETTSYGLKRWGQTVSQYDNPFYNEHCRSLAHQVTLELLEYQRNGVTILGIIGLDGSPTCGVSATWSGDWGGMGERTDASAQPGQGVFIRCLKQEFADAGLDLAFLGLAEADPSASIEDLKTFLQNQ